ncbi:unknown [Pseudomonas phage gh-1]|uniref:Uncharacterized protein n=1 Tax=Pseudomonas phage gh-1 TaxID=197783 RepID=Q859D5_9CAUD|nr:hypothetical protein gh-1p41 [Pseudomonas phage gh-1]AAO73180.1 unknown [Pseudomonas phage gh-1]
MQDRSKIDEDLKTLTMAQRGGLSHR